MDVFAKFIDIYFSNNALKHEKKSHDVFDVEHDDLVAHDKYVCEEEDVINEFFISLEDKEDALGHKFCMFHSDVICMRG